MSHELAIIGAGIMAEAITRGVLGAGVLRAEQVIAADISAERRAMFQSELGIHAVEDGATAAKDARIVLLSVKPYQMESVLAKLGGAMREDALVVSVAPGISTASIRNHLGHGKAWRVIRTMPNTPMLVGAGMVAIAPGPGVTAQDLEAITRIFQSSAKVIQTSEEKMDAVTAVSGSGPAYFFFLTEQMIHAGIELGLTAEEARALAIQTAVGAAKMMEKSTDHPAEHRRRVTTPNGTTHAAITHMESNQWPQITVDALKAAARRSKELGK